MARPRKDGNTTIEDQITKQEDAVAKAKAKYDAEVVKLKDLYAKKDEIKKKELLKCDLCIKVTLNGIHYQGICLMA